MAFPCNQFGAQEPGSDEEIHSFATSTYGVTFPMFSKIEVNGNNAAPLYRWLRSQQPGDGNGDEITWNFEKFLVDVDGNAVSRHSPMVTPEELEATVAEMTGGR